MGFQVSPELVCPRMFSLRILRVQSAGFQLDGTLESFTHHQRYLAHVLYLNQNVQDCPSRFCSL